MYKRILFFGLLVLATITACKNETKDGGLAASTGDIQHASLETLTGQWIAMDFCGRANQYGSVLAAMNNAHLPYAYALSFLESEADSVTCYDGENSWKLKVRVSLDTIEMMEAKPGKSVFLVYDPTARELTMFDATSGNAQVDRLVKSKAGSPNGFMAFNTALNHNLFEGVFTPVGKPFSDKSIQFTPGGYINNLPEYDRYLLCVRGNCFLLGDKYDVITLASTKVKDSQKKFAFQYSAQNDTLTIYNMNVTSADTVAQLGSVAYKLLRKLPN